MCCYLVAFHRFAIEKMPEKFREIVHFLAKKIRLVNYCKLPETCQTSGDLIIVASRKLMKLGELLIFWHKSGVRWPELMVSLRRNDAFWGVTCQMVLTQDAMRSCCFRG